MLAAGLGVAFRLATHLFASRSSAGSVAEPRTKQFWASSDPLVSSCRPDLVPFRRRFPCRGAPTDNELLEGDTPGEQEPAIHGKPQTRPATANSSDPCPAEKNGAVVKFLISWPSVGPGECGIDPAERIDEAASKGGAVGSTSELGIRASALVTGEP